MASRRRKWDDEMGDEFLGEREGRRRKRLQRRKTSGHESDPFNRAGNRRRSGKPLANKPREDTRFRSSRDSYLDELMADDEMTALDFELDASYGSDERLNLEELEDYEIDYSSDDWE